MTDGGPAFPCEARHTESRDGKWVDRWIPEGGMSLRDYFAGQALVGFLLVSDCRDNPAKAAAWSYEQADAMLKARESQA